MHLGAEICQKEDKVCEDRISALTDDLLVQILSQIPTKDVVTTMILSKRWRFLWTMVYNIDYEETDIDQKKSAWEFLERLLDLHKATVVECLRIKIDNYPISKNLGKTVIGKYVSHAVEHNVRELNIECNLPINNLPKSLYTCKTLVKLTLSERIVVDVPSSIYLPCLRSLDLVRVYYKDEDTHVRILSSCPVLKFLVVLRFVGDNVTKFRVKVPSLETFTYGRFVTPNDYSSYDTSLVIDSPGLRKIWFSDSDESRIHCTFKNMPRLDVASVSFGWFNSHPQDKFMTSFSSVMFLELDSTDVAFCNGISFPRLVKLKLSPRCSDNNWLEPFMLLLHNSPKLRILMINSRCNYNIGSPLLWNQPSFVPGCLLSHLEVFEWEEFRGRTEEKQVLAYILANSICLKAVKISMTPYDMPTKNSHEYEQKMKDELESMYRASPAFSASVLCCDAIKIQIMSTIRRE